VLNPPPVGAGQIVAKLDGTSASTIGPGFVFWAADNQILMINQEAPNGGVFPGGPPPINASIDLYNPATGERTPVTVDVDLNNNTPTLAPSIIAALEAQGFDIVTQTNFPLQFGGGGLLQDEEDFLSIVNVSPPGELFNAPVQCAEWEFSKIPLVGGNTETFFTLTNTAGITDVVERDGTFFYLRWYFTGCTLDLANLRIALEYIEPGIGEAVVITDEVYPGEDLNLNFLRSTNGTKFYVSPDGRYVTWLKGNIDSLTTTIVITDLETQTEAELITWRAANANSFRTSEGFISVVWVAS
jgi:hypothetical protein